MLHYKFRGNRPAGSGGEDFCRVFTMYGLGGHLGLVTSIILTTFHFHVPNSLHINFGKNGLVGFEKNMFYFLYVNSLGPTLS